MHQDPSGFCMKDLHMFKVNTLVWVTAIIPGLETVQKTTGGVKALPLLDMITKHTKSLHQPQKVNLYIYMFSMCQDSINLHNTNKDILMGFKGDS